jgi:hypothetical protein
MIKKILILLVIISITIPFADAIPLSDKTGLKFTIPVTTDGREFTIDATANFDITNTQFDKDEKSLLILLNSSIDTNLLEIVIPTSLIGGDFKFYLDNTKIFPKFSQGKNSIFVTIEFSGIGKHEIKLQGTTYLDIFDVSEKIDHKISSTTITKIESNPSTNSLIFSLNDTNKDAGQLSIKLSDEIIMPFENNEFIVLLDGVDSNYSVQDDVLKIEFNSDSKKITIIGTYVIPEFYEIAPLVLATSFVGLIVLRKYKKLFV